MNKPDFNGFKEKARLWQTDDPCARLVRFLKELSGDSILTLHEELHARAFEASAAIGAEHFFLQVYSAWSSVPLTSTEMRGYLRQQDHWLVGLHAYLQMIDETFEEIPPPTGTDSDSVGRYVSLTESVWISGNIGCLFLDESFPMAYESVTGRTWPRAVRALGTIIQAKSLST